MRSCQSRIRCSLTSGLAAGNGWDWAPGLQPLRPPAVLPLVVPDALQVGEHLAAEQIDVLQTQLVGHRAEVQQHEKMPNAKSLDPLDQPVAHRRRAAGDQESSVDEVFVGEVAQVEALAQRVA